MRGAAGKAKKVEKLVDKLGKLLEKGATDEACVPPCTGSRRLEVGCPCTPGDACAAGAGFNGRPFGAAQQTPLRGVFNGRPFVRPQRPALRAGITVPSAIAKPSLKTMSPVTW